jgi:outer membrane protein assembly factor BamE (lipoprotein component of BamABCDE complex)
VTSSALAKRILLSSAVVFGSSLLLSCQSPRYKEFSEVKQGMEKDLVLKAAGNPTVARRWNGKDRWIYYYVQTPDGPQTREVHFQDGRAVYVGTKVVPDVSAEDQDRLNDESNAEEQKLLEADYQKWAETVGAVTVGGSRGGAQPAKDGERGYRSEELDSNFREKTYGIPARKSTGFEAVN